MSGGDHVAEHANNKNTLSLSALSNMMLYTILIECIARYLKRSHFFALVHPAFGSFFEGKITI